MSDPSIKCLSAAEWKKFAKGRGLKDAPLLKSLEAVESAAEDPAARMLALAELDKQAELLSKASKSAKEVTAYLSDITKALPLARKIAQAELDAAEAARKQAAEPPDLLSTKLIPLLRLVRKGEVMKAMIATTGRGTAVLLSKKPIGPPRRKLLSSYLGAGGSVKFILGECIWEENANTFVVPAMVSGLDRKLKTALFEQTNTRFKVRVRAAA